MTYSEDIKELLDGLGVVSSIYTRKPVKAPGTITPLSRSERRRIDRLSKERGYRRFTAEHFTRL